MRTLDRYVVREILPPFVLALLIFTFLLVLPPLMDYLENLLAKGVSWSTAARMIWTLVPQALGLTIPMALLVGILIGLGRLSADREAVALLACGVSPYRLLRPILALAVVATAATLYVMLEAIPDANQTFREIVFDAVSKKVETEVRPRVFFDDFPGWVLYPRDEPEPGAPGWKKLFVADSSKPGKSDVHFAARGRLVLDRQKRTVDLVLEDGARYSTGKPGEVEVYRYPGALVLALNPDAVFPQLSIQRQQTEKTIAMLRADVGEKLRNGFSPHPEIIAIQQKFSLPVACLVFAVIGLALGLTVAREGKMAGFVVGVLVIFAYYIVMYLAESQTKGFYRTIEEARGLGAASFLNAHLSRWWPNLVLGAFGLAALIWRARHTDGRLPFNLTRRLAPHAARWRARLPVQAAASRAAGGRPPNVRVVVRIPRLRLPAPGLLDRYIGRTYLRVIGISFFALLGLFYISTFIDRSDKIFKGDAPAALVATLILYMTPKFIYYIIPIATLLAALVTFGLLARTSELTVMKACGISLYRASLSVVLLSLVFSSAIFGLEQRLLARANRQAEIVDAKIKGRQPRVFNPSDQRWLVGSDGAIYHYAIFDPDRLQLSGLTLYQPTADRWALATATRAERAVYRDGGWTAVNAWTQDFRREASRPAVFSEQRLPALEPPDYFKAEQPVAEMMTVGELKRYLTRLAESGLNVMPLEVDLQHKLAFPFVTLVMTLLAVPFGVSTGRRGTLYGIGLAIVIALSYWILMSVFVALGKGGLLAPWLAAWAPNVIVLGSALYLFLTVRT